MIELSVVILPARGPQHSPDPVFWIEGGPGGSAIDDVTAWQDSPLRASRDLVYVDLRGTERSDPLNCDLFDRNRPGYQHFLVPDMFPADGVRRCAAALAKTADLQFYTTPVMMDDLDDVRAALGYDRINLVGFSGGTHSAIVYLHRHPSHVRSIVLDGVVAPYHLSSAGFARYAQNAFDGLARECAANSACHSHFPDVPGDAKRVLAAADAGQARAEIPVPSGGKLIHVVLNREIIAEVMRNRLYTPSDASVLPALLHAAAEGDYRPIAKIALAGRLAAAKNEGIAYGAYFSVVCAEDFPGLNVAKEEKAAAGTFLGPSRVRQEAAACSLWPTKPVQNAFPEFSSNVPVLIISGQLDPVTPAANADEVAKDFPNSLRVVVPSQGHCSGDGLDGFDCVDRLQADFIKLGSVKGLDTACISSIHRHAFSMTATPSR